MGTEAFADEAINRKWDEETAFRVCGTGLRTDGRRTGIPNYARALPVRHVAGRSDGGLDHQQARAFVGRSVARRQPCARTAAAGRKLAGRTLHAVRVRGLQPGTDYRYRIFSQEVLSWPDVNNVTYGKTVGADASRRRAYGFRTFPAAGSGCSFLVLNDIHGKADVLTRLCKRVDFSELGFVAFNGDMSSSVESGEQLFKDYLDASAALFAAGTPILFTRGNHETRGVFADSLGDYFPGRDGRFYGIYRYGDVCILLLDCGEDKPDDHAEYNGLADYDAYRAEECAWLKKAVRSEEFLTASARIVLLHIPPAAGAWHGSVHLNELFVPVLNEAGIDLMLCGHDHRYSFHPAGERDAKFPIVVNDNRSCVRCDVADSLIRLRIAGPRDKTVHTHEFPLKPQFQP